MLSHTDVFVMPSVQEIFGMAVVEAMAAGKPVLASDVGGIPEIIRHTHDGLLVPPNDPEALALALVDLSSEGARMERFASNARKRASEQFSLEAMVQSALKMYGSLA